MATLNHRRTGAFSLGRHPFFFFLALACAVVWGSGPGYLRAETSKPVSRIFSYGSVPKPQVEETVKSLLTKDGKYVFTPEKQTVLVQDIQERVEMIGAVLADLAKPQPNVRVELSFQEFSGAQSGGIQVSGQAGTRDVRGGYRNYPRDGINLNLNSVQTTHTVNSGQFLVVQGGQSASIEVAKQVPFVDYFYTYAGDLGFPVPALRWESVGTRMLVRPTVQGDLIRVEIVPELSTLSQGQYGVLEIKQLSTVVTVGNGVPVQIGGFKGATEDFNRNFFSGGGSSRSGSNSTFTLKATVQ